MSDADSSIRPFKRPHTRDAPVLLLGSISLCVVALRIPPSGMPWLGTHGKKAVTNAGTEFFNGAADHLGEAFVVAHHIRQLVRVNDDSPFA